MEDEIVKKEINLENISKEKNIANKITKIKLEEKNLKRMKS
jgi:hypothetical protein